MPDLRIENIGDERQKRLRVAAVFCSNTKYLAVEAKNFLISMSRRRTLILSSAEDLICKVF